jgi:beta-galactosidase
VVPFKTGLVSPILLGKAVERPISGWEYAVVDLGRRYRPGIATYNSHSYLINRDIPMMVKDIARWEKEIPKISTPLAILYSRTKIQSEGYEHAVIRLRGVDRALVAMLNGRVIYKGRGNDIFDTVIYARLERGENELIVGAPYYGARGELRPPFKDASYSLWLDSVRGYRLHRILRKGGKEEKISGPLMTVDRPSTLSIRFKVVKKSEFSPIYTRISGNVVAQIMLNGIMVGRYYSGGSQDRFYLPEPYLSEDVNELTIVAIPTSQEARLDISFGTYYTARRVEIRI